MARFCGIVGYVSYEETRPGIYEDIVTERKYYGDVLNNKSRWEKTDHLNDDINISSEISILADAFAYQHFSEIKYVEFMGAKWLVVSALPERPRITLTLGGLYNGQQD